jgi:hypothetical protein
MDDFEQQLRNAMARKEQPSSFEAKVFAAIAARRSARWTFWRWEAAAVAATLLLAAVSWMGHEREIRERVEGEAAKARLQLALKITVTELSKIQKTVRTSTEEE